MTTSNKAIKEIAQKVRAWAQYHAKRRDIQASYDFDYDDLCCMCAYASTVLLECLRARDIEAHLVLGTNHVFLEVDGRILDITATQFAHCEKGKRLNAVEFCTKKHLMSKVRHCDREYWNGAEKVKFKNVTECFNYLKPGIVTGFPASQYWASKQKMRKTIKEAIKHCEL